MTFIFRFVSVLAWLAIAAPAVHAQLDAGAEAADGGDAAAESAPLLDAGVVDGDVGPDLPPEPVVVTPDAPTLSPSEATALPLSEPVIDVEVRSRTVSDRLRRSALAVGVLDLKEQKRSAADLGEVLARVEGVAVRRAGGLGSDQRLSLAGLEGDQIRFFLDGLPLELVGFPFGVANVPVTATERVEIYRGVVPIALGADALGGAIQLVSGAPKPGTHASGSYQLGSFDTHRGTLEASHLQRGLYARVAGFADYARNDYAVTVDEAGDDGREIRARIHRFHDAYRAEGGQLTLGVVDRPWAKRLLLRSFVTDYRKEIQSDVFMRRVYGDTTSGGMTTGATLTYQHAPSERLAIDASGGYTFSVTRLRDLTRCIYNWFGVCTPGALRGELGGEPQDTHLTQHAVYARGTGRYELARGHTLSLALAPTHYRRGGDDRYEPRPGARDPLDVDRRLSSIVVGVEYAALTLSDALEVTAFGKSYLQWVRSEELLPEGEDSVRRDRSTRRFGAGATARYTLAEPVWLKLSYEYATRLPSVDEVFGDGVLVFENLQLAPEVSHNGNVSLAGDLTHPHIGRIAGEASAFLRDADRLILLLGQELAYQHQNVERARSRGGMVSASWTAKGEALRVGGNATYQSFRNRSTEGQFARFEGDRMPNRPYLFVNGSVRAQMRGLFGGKDTLSVTFTTRYTHGFFRSWESAGRRETKARIPSQLVHAIVLSHVVAHSRTSSLSTTLELQNLTDERVFDYYGVEKPGRAAFAKIVAEH